MPSGSCFCHKLEYEFTGEPQGVAMCHCLSCKKISGGTHTVNLLIPEDKVHVTVGSPKQCTQIHESGMKLTVNFCGNCGGAIYKTADRETFAGLAIVQMGTIDEPDILKQVRPGMELYTKYRVPWLSSLEDTIQKPEF
ncbi:hypothetical protein N7474_005346 [Penicillium riverlandense]|uniref:uncharacterized protein n=1 Tax=Penicillium riverlandense TaxID=1903569 RepID=UPI0025466DB2|nr:uncharacterized protein N7474_005346 [Penicillium riverlandense]KAJ5819755.1 hypothetical protein N7474_005346 [Penicillium riverlandense]